MRKHTNSSKHKNDLIETNNLPETEESTLKIRFALAGILFLLVLIFDMSNKQLAGISTEQLFRTISIDYGSIVENWLEAISLQTQ